MENDKLVKASEVKECFSRVIFGADRKIDAWVDAIPAVDAVEEVRIDELIEKYQKKADEFFALAKHFYGDGAVIDRYKWSHSLASTYRDFVNDLDSICGARMDGSRKEEP